ncbi:MAG: sugar phosphate isomerase/epimerase [Chloroflexi bacterium]|nr:sugar phosphate isomerase/epimerase [Chloroflexota bacterium]
MKLVLFSKGLQDHDVAALIERGHELGVDGYDLAVRPGYVVSPDNVTEMLPAAVRRLGEAGLVVPLVTASTDLVSPEHPTAKPIIAAMGKAGVPLLKLGYFRFDPRTQDYWEEVDKARRALDGWQELGRAHGVKVCCHTHSGPYLGNNGAALMHLLRGRDPQLIGAYLDPAHLALEGGPFAVELNMARRYLSLVALKDPIRFREDHGDEGGLGREIVEAGQGMVRWSEVLAELARVGYRGPFSVHGEFKAPDQPIYLAACKREVAYFRAKLGAAFPA